MKTTTIPVVIGALGVIKKGMRSNIEKIPGKISLEELQKITLLGLLISLEKFCQLTYETLFVLRTMDQIWIYKKKNKDFKRHSIKIIIMETFIHINKLTTR